MCFSAGASFSASAVIGLISIACFAKATTPAQRVWAYIPLIFSIQQAIEGILWLSLIYPAFAHLYTVSMYGFLLFAQVAWPLIIPIAALAPEPSARHRKVLKIFVGIGVAVAAYHLYCLLRYEVQALAQSHHIHYNLYYPKLLLRISGKIYFIPAIFPLFFSSLRPVRWMGYTLVVSYLASRIFYASNIISVWCYLAAVLSVIVLLIIIDLNKSKPGISVSETHTI